MSSPTPSLRRRSSLKDYFSSQIPRLPSLRSRRSTLSINSTHSRENSSGYAPYAVHQQNMAPIILRDPEATQKLLEYIFDSSGGRRSLARLARTCKAFREPALDMLWRDLDSFVPLITLFPNTLLKRARRPALGLVGNISAWLYAPTTAYLDVAQARSPEEEDWEKVLAYGERVKSVTYVEAFNTLSQSIFPVLEMCPREYLLPNLTSLTWKAETATGLNYCRPYLTSKLRTFTLEMGVRAPRIGDFLDEVMNKTQLTTFCFTLHSNLPENFVTVMKSNERFEKLAVMAPGALASGVGLWASRLPSLKSLSLDLSNASNLAVTRFFDDIQFASGYSTPSRTDSGVFSASDSESDDKRKSVVGSPSGRILERPFYGAFPSLSQINLTGDAANVVAFLQKLASPLTHIELALEDPPARDDWQTLCMLFSERYGQTLQVLRITAASASRFAELVRSTSRGANDVALRHLPLHHLSPLPRLHRLEIELPESAVFHNADVAHLARVCPNLEVVRLCGQARFPASYGPPPLTLEGLIPLTSGCTKLHTLAVVVHALDGADKTFRVRENSSRALLKLNVGHSWVRDPLQTAILISHIAPHLEILRWFTPTGRSGVVEQHAVAWQKVQDYLPAIQKMRLIERSLMPKPVVIVPPKKKDKEVDATVCTSSVGVSAVPVYFDQPMQAEPPEMVDVEVEVVPAFASVEIDATPAFCDEGVDAMPELMEEAIQADDPPEEELEVERAESITSESSTATHSSLPPILTAFVPSIGGITSLPLRAVRAYTYYISLPFRYVFSFAPMPALVNYATMNEEPKSPSIPVANGEDDDISEKHMHHMNPSTSAADENSMLVSH